MKAVSLDTLPLGFRFRPTDEELIHHYLRLKINSRHSEVYVIPEVDVCKWEPWDLPRLSMIKTEDPEWFFFCPRDRKYPNGQRSNRATNAGYWKATGKDRSIKSCKFKSASNTSGLIGMKKTLVFYRGRAPKGERTNWIMHEYRPTLKDLDGTGPGQSAYVLCRLFHKTEEKSDSLNYDEVEQSDLSPSTNKSCPDDTPSNFLQETATSNLQGGDQSDSIKGSLNDKTDNMTPIANVPGKSCCSSYIASEFEDHVTGETPVKSQLDVDAVPYVDSPFASDFGTDNNGLNFLDGTSEQDASLTYLLDEFYNNHEEFSCEESTSHKNSANDSNIHSSGPLGMSHNIPLGDTCLNGVDMYTEISKVDGPFESSPAKLSGYEQLKLGDIRGFGGNIDGRNICNDSSAGGSGNPVLDEYEKSASWNYPFESYGCQFRGTGIKIRTRQPHYQISDNYIDQGTASRRILLQRSKLPGSMSNTRDTNQSKEQDEVESACTEARDSAKQSPVYRESETKCAILEDKTELISRRTALNCVNINSEKARACHRQHQPCKSEILTQGFAPGSIRLQTNNPTSSISCDSARELSPSIKNRVQLVANTCLSEFHSHSMQANSEKEDKVDSVSTKAKEVTKLGPIFDKLYEENHLLDIDISKEAVEEESFTGQVDQNREVYDTSSAELIDSSRVSFEESSAKLRFRGKQGNVLVSHQKQSLLSLQSSHLHHGWLSLLFRLGICVILVMFIILLGLWRSSDPSAAWEIL